MYMASRYATGILTTPATTEAIVSEQLCMQKMGILMDCRLPREDAIWERQYHDVLQQYLEEHAVSPHAAMQKKKDDVAQRVKWLWPLVEDTLAEYDAMLGSAQHPFEVEKDELRKETLDNLLADVKDFAVMDAKVVPSLSLIHI